MLQAENTIRKLTIRCATILKVLLGVVFCKERESGLWNFIQGPLVRFFGEKCTFLGTKKISQRTVASTIFKINNLTLSAFAILISMCCFRLLFTARFPIPFFWSLDIVVTSYIAAITKSTKFFFVRVASCSQLIMIILLLPRVNATYAYVHTSTFHVESNGSKFIGEGALASILILKFR